MGKYVDEKTILLVEDNPDDVELILRAFRLNNVPNKIFVARDGVEALDYLLGNGIYADRNGRHLPVLILLDLKLPHIDGLEILKRIRGNEKTRLIPVVVLTSTSEQIDLIRSYELGANSYIRKPVDFREFIEIIKALAAYWLILNQPALTGRA